MFVTTLAAAALLAPAPLKLTVSSVSLFKNGFAVVVREAPIPAGGVYTFDEFPSSVLGTMWLTASPGVKFREVVSTTEDTPIETPVLNLDEMLQANVGKVLVVQTSDKSYSGTLEGIAGSLIVFKTDTETVALPKAQITRVSSVSPNVLVWKMSRSGLKRVIRVSTDAEKAGKIFVASLERGATWSPAYAVDISDAKKLKLVSRATILDDTLDIKNIEVRLITGFPNIPFIAYWDPFAVYQSVDQFVNSLMNMGTPAQLRREGGMLSQNAAFRDAGFDEAFNLPGVQGFSAEDLFFYPLKNVSLKKGDRGYYVLFSALSDYTHVYQWDIPDKIVNDRYQDVPGALGDVWHSLRFKNTSEMPLTTAVATVFKDGEVLGQDMLNYTSAGAETSIRMTKALDVRAEDAEEETGRERIDNLIRGGYYDLVTLKGTLDVTNRKGERIKLNITKELTGEVIAADMNPKKKNIVKGLRAVNPRQLLSWDIDLKKGEKTTITYTYKVYVAR